MLNLGNLSDVDFEYLCKDIMSKELNVNLRRFGPGRDHGVDLVDDVNKKNIVIQVKHYINSNHQSLLSSLKNEVSKLENMSPTPGDYYVCCSARLTAEKQNEIYNLFSKYMHSASNVYDLVWISDFLEKSENLDILRRHYKLWMESTNILNILQSKDIFIDSEVLVSDILSHKNLYVQTRAYQDAIRMLEKRNVLMIVGSPGVGKTITSEMLVLYFLARKYHLRYTTDVTDLKSIKKSLSDNPEVKEIILLDDCFGQAYFNMAESQTNELLSLIKYIHTNKNKILILNSRITIFNVAITKNKKLIECIDRKEYSYLLLDLDQQPLIDKAFILYNHLYFNKVNSSFLKNITFNKNYLKIVQHKNYNPRIIEYVTIADHLKQLAPSEYSQFIMQKLNTPDKIWEDEYERRLQPEDQVLLQTLYSLTDTAVQEDLLIICYNNRIINEPFFVSTIDQYHRSMRRLLNSMVTIVNDFGIKKIKVANPSINDFLRSYLNNSAAIVNTILDRAKSVYQYKRLIANDSEFNERLRKRFENYSILEFEFDNQHQKNSFITGFCSKNHIYDAKYTKYINEYFMNITEVNIFDKLMFPAKIIFGYVFQDSFCTYYGLDKMLSNISSFESIINKLSLEECIDFISESYGYFDSTKQEEYADLIDSIILDKIYDEYSDIEVSEYDFDISDIIKENTHLIDDNNEELDWGAATEEIERSALDAHLDIINSIISDLPSDYSFKGSIDSDAFRIYGAESLIESHLFKNYDNDRDDIPEDNVSELNQIDNLFNWDND